jgi:glucosamine 6-phosphate synthetase-like amidotransferase/phosphosugar isomerase protein
MEEEIWNQAEDIPKFASRIRKLGFSKLEPSTLIFSGAGDSYATAVFAQELSSGQAVSSDPYELLKNISIVKGKNLIIVSVSGKTQANIDLARRAKKFARKRIAITANNDSSLAKECDESLLLEYGSSGVLTAGTISFTCSLIACASLLGQLPKTLNVTETLEKAENWGTSQVSIGTGSFLFIGSGVNYALSMYGASKVREVLGAKAEADFPEQLGHARLFTVDKRRDTIICISSSQDKARQIYKLLDKNGFRTNLLTVPADKTVRASLNVAVHLQQLALTLARKRGMTECAFLADPRTLELSNSMIYK